MVNRTGLEIVFLCAQTHGEKDATCSYHDLEQTLRDPYEITVWKGVGQVLSFAVGREITSKVNGNFSKNY